ncbi:ribonuclease H-like domain-containing protein [Tanacetum coccineum]
MLQHTSPLHRSHVHALRDPNWKEAMLDEYNALITNEMWVLVPRPANVNVVHSMWLFKHKFNADGSLSRYKAPIVLLMVQARQQKGIGPPLDTESKLGPDGEPVSDPSLYRSLAGALQYLTFTRPDISYVVQQVSLYMHDPRDPHFTALKRILRYVRGTIDHGLQLIAGGRDLSCVAYVVVDCRGFEICYLVAMLLCLLHTFVYCAIVSAVYLSTNPVQHQRTKHIEIDIHFVRDYVASGQVRVLHVRSDISMRIIFTKGLLSAFCFLSFAPSHERSMISRST